MLIDRISSLCNERNSSTTHDKRVRRWPTSRRTLPNHHGFAQVEDTNSSRPSGNEETFVVVQQCGDFLRVPLVSRHPVEIVSIVEIPQSQGPVVSTGDQPSFGLVEAHGGDFHRVFVVLVEVGHVRVENVHDLLAARDIPHVDRRALVRGNDQVEQRIVENLRERKQMRRSFLMPVRFVDVRQGEQFLVAEDEMLVCGIEVAEAQIVSGQIEDAVREALNHLQRVNIPNDQI